MTTPRRAFVAAALALPLGACISLFPKSEPDQLYRFGAQAPQVQLPAGRAFGVLKISTAFTRAAGGDRILTVSGGEAAFVKGARWVSPATVLFDEALTRAFQGGDGRARLINRGEVAQADYALKLDVRTFEARYDQGAKAAPQVNVEVRAMLTRNGDRALAGEKIFAAQVRAGDNRLGAIAQAYDQAVVQVLGELLVWVNATGG